MQQVWTQQNPGEPDVEKVMRFVADKSAKFDRGVRWRNLREWLGGLAGLAMILYSFRHFQTVVELTFLCSMGVLLVAVCAHLWLKGRVGETVDPALDRERYRDSMERKFSRQIRMLLAVKYWFLVPLTAIGLATAWTYLRGTPGEDDWFYFPLILVGALLAWWANDCAVRGARREWDRIREAIDDGRIE